MEKVVWNEMDSKVMLRLNPKEIPALAAAIAKAAPLKNDPNTYDVIIGRDQFGVLYVQTSIRARVFKSYEIDTDGHTTRRY